MQGKLLINKPGQIPCGLINANNHLTSHQQQQQPQHLSSHNHLSHSPPHHNGLTFSVSVNPNNNRLMNGRDHKKLDRSLSEPVEKILLSPLSPNNKYLQTQNNRNNGNQRSLTTAQQNTINNNVKNNSSSCSSNSSNGSGNNSTSSSRYKTELCRPFEENGTCKYGDKCQFAHGYHELRNLQRHPRYKTVLCRTFHTVGFCPYGPRCHFIHNSEESKKNIIHTLQAGGPNSEKNSSDSLIFDNEGGCEILIVGGKAILSGPLGSNNNNNINSNAVGIMNNLASSGMRPKALSIGSCSLDGSSSSGDLSQPSTPPSGSPASLSSCFDQNDRLHFTPNSFDGSTNSGDSSAFSFTLNRDSLSLCEQEFLSLSLSPRWSF